MSGGFLLFNFFAFLQKTLGIWRNLSRDFGFECASCIAPTHATRFTLPPFQRQFIKSSTISKTIVLVLLSILTTLELGCSSDTKPSPPVTGTVEPLSDSKIAQIETFCGDCHHLPSPSSFPKTRWAQEVFQGFAFYEDSNRTDMVEPIRMDTVRYFVERAPVQVDVPRSDSFAESPTSVKFEEGGLEGERFLVPTTSNIQLDSNSKSIFFTNMGEGELRQISIDSIGKGKSNLIATGKNICRAYLCDWDGDSKQDYLLRSEERRVGKECW